jgi:hypothetical protein
MRAVALLVACSFALWGQAKPRIQRAELAAVERVIDERLEKASLENPLVVLGLTRSVYLDGYGVVLSTEVEAARTPGLSPFRPSMTKEEIARFRTAKLARMPLIRKAMRELLVSAAASLDSVPPEEQVVFAVSLFYFNWEDRSGLPQQIVMQARRGQLLEVVMNQDKAPALDGFLRVREF